MTKLVQLFDSPNDLLRINYSHKNLMGEFRKVYLNWATYDGGNEGGIRGEDINFFLSDKLSEEVTKIRDIYMTNSVNFSPDHKTLSRETKNSLPNEANRKFCSLSTCRNLSRMRLECVSRFSCFCRIRTFLPFNHIMWREEKRFLSNAKRKKPFIRKFRKRENPISYIALPFVLPRTSAK
jgi:hypothetical protein